MNKKLLKWISMMWFLGLVSCLPSKQDTSFPQPPNYQGVVPGQTTEAQTKAILGEPERVSVSKIDNVRYWFYDKLQTTIIFSLKDNRVSWIDIEDETLTLGDIVDVYGIPELVLVTNAYESESESYKTHFHYFRQGVVARISTIPPLSRDIPVTSLWYFEPMEIEMYIERFGDITRMGEVIDWPGFEE